VTPNWINFTYLCLQGILLLQIYRQTNFLFASIPYEVVPICTDTAITAGFPGWEALLEEISRQRLYHLLRFALD